MIIQEHYKHCAYSPASPRKLAQHAARRVRDDRVVLRDVRAALLAVLVLGVVPAALAQLLAGGGVGVVW
jgi:hypothetical protein